MRLTGPDCTSRTSSASHPVARSQQIKRISHLASMLESREPEALIMLGKHGLGCRFSLWITNHQVQKLNSVLLQGETQIPVLFFFFFSFITNPEKTSCEEEGKTWEWSRCCYSFCLSAVSVCLKCKTMHWAHVTGHFLQNVLEAKHISKPIRSLSSCFIIMPLLQGPKTGERTLHSRPTLLTSVLKTRAVSLTH